MAFETGNYRYSYSGADAKVFAYFEGFANEIVQLESAATISWSAYEGASDVRALGHKGVRGFAPGVRTVAGSIIMIVIEDNPFAEIMDLIVKLTTQITDVEGEEVEQRSKLVWPGWSLDWEEVGIGSGVNNYDFNRRLAMTLPPINFLVEYVTETLTERTVIPGTSTLEVPRAAWLLSGVKFITEGLVTSVNDVYTEQTYSFKATDIKPLGLSGKVPAFSPDVHPDVVMSNELASEIFRPIR